MEGWHMEEKECPAGQSGAENGDVNWELYPIVNPETGEQETLLYPSPEEWAETCAAMLKKANRLAVSRAISNNVQIPEDSSTFDFTDAKQQEIFKFADENCVWEPLRWTKDEFAETLIGFPSWEEAKNNRVGIENTNIHILFYPKNAKWDKKYARMSPMQRRERIEKRYFKEIQRLSSEEAEDFIDFMVKKIKEFLKEDFSDTFPTDLVMSAGELMSADFEKREMIIEGVLQTKSLNMIWGWRGLGKTFLVMDMAIAIAKGNQFLGWDVPVSRRVLFVDGEMAASDLCDRVRGFCGESLPELLEFIPSEIFYYMKGESLNIGNPDHQEAFLGLLRKLRTEKRAPEVIIFDNLSSMTTGDENSNADQDNLLSFMRDLRHLGYAVIVIHHAGKGGDQRGASRREDFLDLSIKLDKASGGGAGCRFKMEFTKSRGKTPQPEQLECALMTDENNCWVLVSATPAKKPQKWELPLLYIRGNNPRKQEEIADALDIAASTVSGHLKKAAERGLVKGLVLTPKGEKYLSEKFPEEEIF